MRSRYYLYGTLFGLFCAIIYTYVVLGHNFIRLFSISFGQKYFGGLSITIGSLSALGIARWLDRKNISQNFLIRALLLPVFIFLLGITVGSATNGIISGNSFHFYDHGIKPLAVLSLFGLPASVAVGVIYYFSVKIINKLAKLDN